MSHEIRVVDGRADMAYVGETPWHGLGQKLDPDEPLESWAIKAGMNYLVKRSRVRFGEGEHMKIWDDQHVLFRDDTKAPLSVVSKKFKIVQPIECLEFFRHMIEKLGAKMETAGVLFEGKRYWALARLPINFKLPGNDTVSAFVLMATSCDGTIATVNQFTSIRDVCHNTLQISLKEQNVGRVKTRHSSVFDATKVQQELGLLEESFDEFRADCEALTRKRLSKATAVQILIEALSDPDAFRAGKPIAELPNARLIGEMIDLYAGRGIGSSLASSNGTAWGLVNAATEYFDHHAGRTQDARLASAWFGPNLARKQAVLTAALAA